MRVLAEYDGTGTLISRFVYATRPNVPDYVVQGTTTLRLVTDHLGSPRLLINGTTGVVAGAMNHDEYGRVTQDSLSALIPFGYAGGLYDHDTKLVRLGSRDYDAETGRWATRDPARFAGGDTNLYAYAANDPINEMDPQGMQRRNSLNLTPEAQAVHSDIDGVAPLPGTFDLGIHAVQDGFLLDGQAIPAKEVDKLVARTLQSKEWKEYAKNNPTQRRIRVIACKAGKNDVKVGWAKDYIEGMRKHTDVPLAGKAPKHTVDFVNGEMGVLGYDESKGQNGWRDY